MLWDDFIAQVDGVDDEDLSIDNWNNDKYVQNSSNNDILQNLDQKRISEKLMLDGNAPAELSDADIYKFCKIVMCEVDSSVSNYKLIRDFAIEKSMKRQLDLVEELKILLNEQKIEC